MGVLREFQPSGNSPDQNGNFIMYAASVEIAMRKGTFRSSNQHESFGKGCNVPQIGWSAQGEGLQHTHRLDWYTNCRRASVFHRYLGPGWRFGFKDSGHASGSIEGYHTRFLGGRQLIRLECKVYRILFVP